MDPERLTSLIAYHTKLYEDAIASGNAVLAAIRSGELSALQMARGPWESPRPESGAEAPDPRLAQLDALEAGLAELRKEIDSD